MTRAGIGRRQALTGMAGVGLGLPVLGACGGDDGPPAAEESPAGDGAAIASTSDVAVGGATILADHEVVLSQPSEGGFRAFSTTCTHQGCPVDKVADGRILCPCHGSAFSVTDGSVVNGPATSPLEEVPVNVDGDQIRLG